MLTVWPIPGRVIEGVPYGPTGTDWLGTYRPVTEDQVLMGVQFGAASVEYTGCLFLGMGIDCVVENAYDNTGRPTYIPYPDVDYGVLVKNTTMDWLVRLIHPTTAWPDSSLTWTWKMRLAPQTSLTVLGLELTSLSVSRLTNDVENDTLCLLFSITGGQSNLLSAVSHLVEIIASESTDVSGVTVERYYPSAYGKLFVRDKLGSS